MVAFCARGAKRIWVLDEALPLFRVLPFGVWHSESVPDTRVDFGHLRPFDDFDFALGTPRLFRIGRSEERPGGVVRTATCGGPYLKNGMNSGTYTKKRTDGPLNGSFWGQVHVLSTTLRGVRGRSLSIVRHIPIQYPRDQHRSYRSVRVVSVRTGKPIFSKVTGKRLEVIRVRNRWYDSDCECS
jgi:hypothetical protein